MTPTDVLKLFTHFPITQIACHTPETLLEGPIADRSFKELFVSGKGRPTDPDSIRKEIVGKYELSILDSDRVGELLVSYEKIRTGLTEFLLEVKRSRLNEDVNADTLYYCLHLLFEDILLFIDILKEDKK